MELRPEMCENPVYSQTVTAPGCDTFGYTTFTCDSCGYAYTDHYTLYQHTVTQWDVVNPATEEAEGLEAGNCDLCGFPMERSVPKLEPAPTVPETEAPATVETTEPQRTDKQLPKLTWLAVGIGAAVLILIIAVLLKPKKKKRGKFQK